MRIRKIFKVKSNAIQQQLLQWAAMQDVCCVMNSNRAKQLFVDPYSSFNFLVAAGVIEEISPANGSFDALRLFHNRTKDWLFGYFTYDLKNETENLSSKNFDGLNFPAIHFFQPRYLLKLEGDLLTIEYLPQHDDEQSVERLLKEITRFTNQIAQYEESRLGVQESFQPRVSKEEYLSIVDKIKQHIQQGDVYELNYCMEFFSENGNINAADIYSRLNETSPMPFSCYYKNRFHHVACASPERFLARRGNKIISQPMKGTARRGHSGEEDKLLKEQLKNSQKEKSENVMIVDLVRNDLSRTALRNSVKVEEALNVYSFRQLHQMISTVVAEIRDGIHWTEVIKQAFPMGSMTGAPKVRAMQLIEEYEATKRGLYSGATGYITPDGDFDFNVVIRSILYNEENNYLSFMVGSAITALADAGKEYEECLLKAKTMMETLSVHSLGVKRQPPNTKHQIPNGFIKRLSEFH